MTSPGSPIKMNSWDDLEIILHSFFFFFFNIKFFFKVSDTCWILTSTHTVFLCEIGQITLCSSHIQPYEYPDILQHPFICN